MIGKTLWRASNSPVVVRRCMRRGLRVLSPPAVRPLTIMTVNATPQRHRLPFVVDVLETVRPDDPGPALPDQECLKVIVAGIAERDGNASLLTTPIKPVSAAAACGRGSQAPSSQDCRAWGTSTPQRRKVRSPTLRGGGINYRLTGSRSRISKREPSRQAKQQGNARQLAPRATNCRGVVRTAPPYRGAWATNHCHVADKPSASGLAGRKSKVRCDLVISQ